jgi:hypothetical protein
VQSSAANGLLCDWLRLELRVEAKTAVWYFPQEYVQNNRGDVRDWPYFHPRRSSSVQEMPLGS